MVITGTRIFAQEKSKSQREDRESVSEDCEDGACREIHLPSTPSIHSEYSKQRHQSAKVRKVHLSKITIFRLP